MAHAGAVDARGGTRAVMRTANGERGQAMPLVLAAVALVVAKLH
jgi:hypothetical protein